MFKTIKNHEMKPKILTILSVVLLSSIVSSCLLGPTINGNGNVTKVQRESGSFEKIKVTRGMNVYISQGDVQKIVVEADENLMDYIETNIEDKTLKITTSANIRRSKSKKVFVTVTDITEISASAGSNVFSENDISCKNLVISGSAGSNIKLQVNAKEIEVSASAGSNITLEGNAGEVDLKASAGSNIKAGELETNKCDVRTSSGANIWIKVTNDFDGRASSGGNVYYSGNPKRTNIEKSSGGNVIQQN